MVQEIIDLAISSNGMIPKKYCREDKTEQRMFLSYLIKLIYNNYSQWCFPGYTAKSVITFWKYWERNRISAQINCYNNGYNKNTKNQYESSFIFERNMLMANTRVGYITMFCYFNPTDNNINYHLAFQAIIFPWH